MADPKVQTSNQKGNPASGVISTLKKKVGEDTQPKTVEINNDVASEHLLGNKRIVSEVI
jgi:hypothetical protein